MQFQSKIVFGTGGYGMDPSHYEKERYLIASAFAMGYRWFDTAEIYGYGEVEQMLGDTLHGKANVISKFLPSSDPIKSVEQSIARLKRPIDIYLLHWLENVDIEKTISSLISLKKTGKIKQYGVSNFSTQQLTDWLIVDCALGGSTYMHQLHISQTNLIHDDFIALHKKNSVLICAHSPMNNGELGSASLQYTFDKSDMVVVKSKNEIHLKDNIEGAWLLK